MLLELLPCSGMRMQHALTLRDQSGAIATISPDAQYLLGRIMQITKRKYAVPALQHEKLVPVTC